MIVSEMPLTGTHASWRLRTEPGSLRQRGHCNSLGRLEEGNLEPPMRQQAYTWALQYHPRNDNKD